MADAYIRPLDTVQVTPHQQTEYGVDAYGRIWKRYRYRYSSNAPWGAWWGWERDD